jgi:hypothetical protein
MEQFLIPAIIATVLFSILKFIEMKYLDKQMKPLKTVIRDAFMVFVSSLVGVYVFSFFGGSVQEFLNIVTESKTLNAAATQVFTDVPGF